MERELNGKVALVTGAGGAGCGGAIARIMAEHGASVVVMERHEARCRATADEIGRKYGVPTVACPVDIADRVAVDAALSDAVDAVGPVNILVNNAAINVQGSIFDYDPADFDKVLAVDFVACWYLTRAVIGGMRDRGWGSIINVSSVAGYMGGAGIEAPYAASKAALHDLTRGTAVEGGPFGIRCNGIAVGLVRSKFIERDPHLYEHSIAQTPLRRVAEPREIAQIALFLASERSSFITGEIVNASGGLVLGQ